MTFKNRMPGFPYRYRTLGAIAAMMLVSGCLVGPDFKRPDAPEVIGYTRLPLATKTAGTNGPGGAEQSFIQNLDIPYQWWTLFQSPQLNTLIEKAFQANPTIVAAREAIRQANEFVYAQQGFFFPTVQANYSISRQKSSDALSAPLSVTDQYYNLHTAQVTVGFVPDVLGGNRRQVESLSAQAEAQRFQLEATYLTLSTNVVAAAIQEASLRAQIAATREIIKTSTKSLDLLRRQFEQGYAAGLDVSAQESALAQFQAALPPLQKQLEQTRDLLMALAGRFPSGTLEETFDLETLHLPQELPVSLPSKLVEHRPDVRAAEEQLHSASALIGVAIANQLPNFSINATAGGVATQIGQMFTPGNVFWSVGGNVAQTLFAGGTLLHRKYAAEAAFNQAAAQYKSTVITAFQNVADTLYALQSDADSLKATVEAERAAKATLEITVKQQQLGYVNYLSLLNAQQAHQLAVITRVQAQASRFADTAALFQALGGGWWNRVDDAPPPTAPPLPPVPSPH